MSHDQKTPQRSLANQGIFALKTRMWLQNSEIYGTPTLKTRWWKSCAVSFAKLLKYKGSSPHLYTTYTTLIRKNSEKRQVRFQEQSPKRRLLRCLRLQTSQMQFLSFSYLVACSLSRLEVNRVMRPQIPRTC